MPRRVEDSVVVITGASSGIGRAAAQEFARRGASIVLASRGEEGLREAAEECQKLGGKAFPVTADVTDEQSVQHLARRAIEVFGRFDVWVNNAGVIAYGRADEMPSDSFRQVLETNLFGTVHGCRAAIPHFRERGEGVLINVASELGKFGIPNAGAYVASKFGVVGLSECLREESMDCPNIHVCTLLPSAIDTPLFQKAGNYTGKEIKAPPPVYDPEEVAAAIVGCVERPQREVVVGHSGRRQILMHTFAPGLTERMAVRSSSGNYRDAPASDTEGNLFDPMPHYDRLRGGWKKENPTPWGLYALVGLGALAIGYMAFSSQEQSLGGR